MQCTIATIARKFFLLSAALSLWATPASTAPKTDVVIFNNGDQLTGEIKSLKRGHLSLNTEATGTIGIEWDKISNVVSDQRIQLETSDGIRYFGGLTNSEKSSTIVVATDNGPIALDAVQVIAMTPIEGIGIHALDVDVSLGYNFAKAGSVKTGSLGMNMKYRSLIRIESLSFSTTISDSSTQDASTRMTLGLQHSRLWNKRWFSNADLTFDQNDELGLNLRTSVGSGGGRFLIQSNTMLLALEAGLQFSRENLKAEDDDTDSLESRFSVKWDWFVFEEPELDWSTTLQVIPSLTETGRVRAEFDTALKWELINDLNWVFSFYGSQDNQPQSETGSTNDYGVNMTLAYEF